MIKKLVRGALPISPKLKQELSPSDYVFITQYYKNGGAERVINNYISALKKLHPEVTISIVATDFDDNATWIAGIPEEVQFIDLSAQSNHLPRYLRVRLLSQALKQLSPRTIHIVNSKVALDLVAKQASPKLPYRAYVSLFNSDFSASGRLRTYYKELGSAGKNISAVFTDNKTVIDEAVKATDMKKTQFRVHYQPIIAQVQTPHILPKTGKLHILWASRITHQKRPDILRSIARNLPESQFSIDIYGALVPPFNKSYFADVYPLFYKGGFSSFSEIDTREYDLFLYTSQADGLPNILLEATAAGLPVIAPNVGGVSEFISNQTGFLVDNFDDIKSYVSILEAILSNRTDLRPKVRSAQNLLTSRHSAEDFINSVKSDIIA